MSVQQLLYLTPKSSFYESQKSVIEKAENLHTEAFNQDRELYTYLLYFLRSTYYSKSLFVKTLLKNSLYKTENNNILQKDNKRLEIEDELIYHALMNENITHALKLLLNLKKDRVNNARTTKLILKFLFKRNNIDKISIKYKNKVKTLLIHALGMSKVNNILTRSKKGENYYNKFIAPYSSCDGYEVIDFVFNKEREYKNEFFKEYLSVREAFINKNFNNIKKHNVPIEVLMGFNNFYKTYLPLSSLTTLGNVSEKQKIQLQKAVKRSNENVQLKIDFSKYGLIDLMKYLYADKELSESERTEILSHIENQATKLKEDSRFETFKGEEFAIIFDFSESMQGSKETHLHPFFKTLALEKVLGNDGKVFYVGGEKSTDDLFLPKGDTNLTETLLKVTKEGFTNVLIVSDGFENSGSFEEVYQKLSQLVPNLNVLHLNPVFSPKNFSFKSLSNQIATIPFYDIDNLNDIELFFLLETNPMEFKKQIRTRILEEVLKN